MKPLKQQSGLSLIEMLVAMVISIFLLGGIISVYMGNKATYRFSDTNSIIQENARFALDIITNDARMAGFWGCMDLQDLTGDMIKDNPKIHNVLDNNSANYDASIHNFLGLPPISATVNDGLNGSDSLTIRGAKPGQSNFRMTLVQPGTADIVVTENRSIDENDIILITNCYSATIFEASAVNTADGITTISHATGAGESTPGNISTSLMTEKDPPFEAKNAALFSMQTVTYTIEQSLIDPNEPALFRKVNKKDKEELIAGIEEMHVFFGEDTDGDEIADTYHSSDKVTSLQNIKSIRLWLLLRSDEEILTEEQTYTLNGVATKATDLRMRQVYSSTIALRNKEIDKEGAE